MSVASHSIRLRIADLRENERAVLRRSYRYKGAYDKVRVNFFDVPKETVNAKTHESGCVMVVNTSIVQPCTCGAPEFGHYATFYVDRGENRSPVCWRFVPRPLTLEDAVVFGEVDAHLAQVHADRLLEDGNPRGERLTLSIYKNLVTPP